MNISESYKLTHIKKTEPVPSGINAVPCSIKGKFKSRGGVKRRYLKEAQKIYTAGLCLEALSEEELKSQLSFCKEIFQVNQKISFNDLCKSITYIQEAVSRVLGFRPFKEQIAGAIALYNGYIIEMSTGEGKTVTAVMAAIIRGWTAKPCHIITANDYLASRDADIMQKLYNFCHVSVGSVTSEMKPAERKEAYLKDVTYSTAKEILADFLRDRILLGQQQKFHKRLIHSLFENDNKNLMSLVQRGLDTAIIDEADNVLIDEAVTPLIISKEEPNKAFEEACFCATQIAKNLQKNKHYTCDIKFRTISFIKDIDQEIKKNAEKHPSPFAGILFQKDLVRKAIIAKEFYRRDQQYVIDEGKIVIVDESTGRKMPMRSWNDGLHQMVELKEGLEMTPVKETQARLSFQRFFRFYKSFSGMTGTGKEAKKEFWLIYGAPIMIIPNHKKNQRTIKPLKVFSNKNAKLKAIIKEVEKIHAQSRPILIGTRNVAESELIASILEDKGLPYRIINAVRSEEEASIIASAGKANAITVSTNMAGRGTDIKITKEVKRLTGLHVIATECHRSSRIDRQLFGRGARQGDPGSAISYSSFEDELLTQNLSSVLFFLLRPFGKLAVRLAQHKAERRDYKSRLYVQKTDSWLNESLSFTSEDIQ